MTTAVPRVIFTDVTHLSKVCPFHTHPLLILLTESWQEEPLKSAHASFSSEHGPCTGICLQCHECRAGQIYVLLTLHSQTSCGIKWFMWLRSGAGFNFWNLVLFGNRCFGGLPKLTEEKIKSPVDSNWVWIKSSGTIYLLTLPQLQKLASALATSSQIQALSSAKHCWEHL